MDVTKCLGKVNKLIFQGVLECILHLLSCKVKSSIAPCGLKKPHIHFFFQFWSTHIMPRSGGDNRCYGHSPVPQGAHTSLVWIVPHWRYVSRGRVQAYSSPQHVFRMRRVSGQRAIWFVYSEMVTTWILYSSPIRRCFSTGGKFAPQGTFGHLEIFSLSQLNGGELLASSR